MATFIYMCDVIQEEALMLHRIQPGDEANHKNIVFVIRTGETLTNAALEIVQDNELIWSSPLKQTPKLRFDEMLPLAKKAHLLYLATARFNKVELLSNGGKCDIQLVDQGKVLRKRTVLFTSLEQDLYHTDNYSEFVADGFNHEMMQDVSHEDFHIAYTKFDSTAITDMTAQAFGDGVDQHVAQQDLSAHNLSIDEYSEAAVEYFTDVKVEPTPTAQIDLTQVNPQALATDIEVRSFGDGIDHHQKQEDLSAHGLDVSEYSEVAIEYIDKKDVPIQEDDKEVDVNQMNLQEITDIEARSFGDGTKKD